MEAWLSHLPSVWVLKGAKSPQVSIKGKNYLSGQFVLVRSPWNSSFKRGCLGCKSLCRSTKSSISHQSKVLLVAFGKIPEFPVGLDDYLMLLLYPPHCSNVWLQDTVALTRHVRHIDVYQLAPSIPSSTCLQQRVRLHLLC